MRNADYWRQRARINSDAAHAEANEYIAQLEEIYRDAVMSVKADLDRWYGRFADNNQITLAEAKKRLTEGELEEFHWTVDKYIKAAEEHGLDPAWQQKLENASARYHISRLEAIQIQIQQQAELVYGNQTDGLDELLRRIADNGYNHAAFDVMKGLGMGWDFAKLDQKRLDAMLKKPWTSDGKTFTDRCWEGKANLIDGIQRELVQSLMRGDSLVKTRDHIAQRFGVSKYKAGRLAHTEATYFNAVSTQACYEDLGVEKIEILETLDKHTCEICAAMDGKVIDKKDYQPGVTVPPFHPNCRGTTCPWFDDMEDVGRRIARDNGGEVYYVPPDMTYKEWQEAHQSHVEWLKSINAKETSLNTLDKYYRAKYDNSPEYQLLQGYARAVGEGSISPLVGFDLYQQIDREIMEKLIGQKTSTGLLIKSHTTHFIDRVIGQTSTSHKDMRCGVTVDEVLDTVLNGTPGKIQTNARGQQSIQIVGKNNAVTINPDTGVLIQVNPKKK